MKKILLAALLTIAALTSCTKEGAKLFEGYYSYKLSGTISLTAVADAEATEESGPEIAPDELTLTLTLAPEAGQMNILTRDRSNGDMVLTMNAIGGDVTTMQAKADGNDLDISPVSKRFTLEITAGSKSYTAMIIGSGERLEDVVIINFIAVSGEYSYLGRKYEVTGSNITCVAKSNGR